MDHPRNLPPDQPAIRIKSMMSNTDKIYGEGFREALAAYYAVGCSLPRLLDEVKRLPSTVTASPE